MERRNFFEGYRATNLTADPLPLKVLNHSIWKAEMLGHALDWALQYLHQKSCPTSLVSPLLGKILDEISTADLSGCYASSYGGRMCDEVDADMVEENMSYQPLKLMQSVTTAVDTICLRYKEEYDRIEKDFPAVEGTEKETPVVFGASYHAIKNTRRTMEDRMVVLPDIDKVFHLKGGGQHYYAVFDGHNGVEAAAYSAAHLHRYLVSSPDFPDDLSAALNYAFEATDTALLMKCKDESIRSGTTAVVSLILPNNIYVAWAGDSQAFLVRDGKVESLVSPHKPDREDEMQRIKSVGGEVISIGGTWRVNGNLAVSRAIGNLDYKEYVTSTPEISHIVTNGSEEFLILACDGLWDVVSPQRCVEILRDALLSDNSSDIDTVGHKLVVEAKKSGSGDNITVIVVFLKSKEDLIKAYSVGKMNGTSEAEAPVAPAPAPASPPKAEIKSSVGPATKTSTVSKSSTSPTKTASTTRTSLSSRTTTTANKAPASRLSMDRKPATAARAPAAASTKSTTATSAAKTTAQSTSTSSTAAAGARPAARRPVAGLTSRTQVASKTATSTTASSTATAAKKPLKPDETEKSVATKSAVPPKSRPGTAPMSSRVAATSRVAAAKTDTNKAGEESKETTKRSALTKSAATSRVASTRPPISAAAPKPRVPPTTSATSRPISATQTQKSASTTTRKPLTSSTTTASARAPAKKPAAPPAKKDIRTQPVPVSKRIVGKAKAPETTAKVNGITEKPVNGVESLPEVKAVNGLEKLQPYINGKPEEAQEVTVTNAKVEDKEAIPVSIKTVGSTELLGGSLGGEEKDIASAVEESILAPTLSSDDKVNENVLKESEVLNGDLVGLVENLVVSEPRDKAENNVAPGPIEDVLAHEVAVDEKQIEAVDVNLISEAPIADTVAAELAAMAQQADILPASADLKASEDLASHLAENLMLNNENLDTPAAHNDEEGIRLVEEAVVDSIEPGQKEPEEINLEATMQQDPIDFGVTGAPQEEEGVIDHPSNASEIDVNESPIVEAKSENAEWIGNIAETEIVDDNCYNDLLQASSPVIEEQRAPQVETEAQESDRMEVVDTVAFEIRSPEPVIDEGNVVSAASPELIVPTDSPIACSPEPICAQEASQQLMQDLDFRSNASPEPARSEYLPPSDSPGEILNKGDDIRATTMSPEQIQPQDIPEVTPDLEVHEEIAVALSPEEIAPEPQEPDAVITSEVSEEVAAVISPEPLIPEEEAIVPVVTMEGTHQVSDILEDVELKATEFATESSMESRSIPVAMSPDLLSDSGEPAALSPEPIVETESSVDDPPALQEQNLGDLVGEELEIEMLQQVPVGQEESQPIIDAAEEFVRDSVQTQADKPEEVLENVHLESELQKSSGKEAQQDQLQLDQTAEAEPTLVAASKEYGNSDVFLSHLPESSGNPFMHSNPFAVDANFESELNSQFSSSGGGKALIPDFSGTGSDNYENDLMTTTASSGGQDLDNMFGNIQSFGGNLKQDEVTWGNNNDFKFEDQGNKILDPMQMDFSTFNTQDIGKDPFGVDAQINGNKVMNLDSNLDGFGLQHQNDHREALLDMQGASPISPSDKLQSTVDPGSHQLDATGN